MEFRVLGALELARDGRVERIPGRIGPRLLALLLLEPGRVVSVNRLVDGVWNAEPPATARAQVRNGISALRRLVGADRLEFTTGGYRLNLDGAVVDARSFTESVSRARELAAAGEPGSAAEVLRSGLDLWRGAAFQGLAGRAFEAAAAQLEELRLAALEDRIELELAQRRDPDVIGELTRLVEDHPYRQRLADLLMRALHRQGRTSQALDVYRALKTRLAEHLGLDPDVSLRERYAALAHGHPAPAPDGPPTGPTVRIPVPAQLPARPITFVGRADYISTLDSLLDGDEPGRSCVITGTAGAGKSALATHWGHDVRDRFPDGQLYVNLRGFGPGEPLSAHAVLERFLTALGISGAAIPAGLDDAARLFRSRVADRRMLLVLDNARDAAQVRPLLPGGAGNLTLVTSRDTLTGLTACEDASRLGLRILTERESLALLAELVGTATVREAPDAARRLVRLCGGLPLALRIAAANLNSRPGGTLAEYVTELDGAHRLDLLAVDGDPDAAVADTFRHSLRNLDATSRDLFLRLGLLPGEDFCDSLAREVTGLDAAETRERLARLRTANLLERHLPGRHRFHDLIRLYARQRAELSLRSAERERTIDRYIDWHHQRSLELPLAETGNIIAAGAVLREHPRFWRLTASIQAVVYAGQAPGYTRQLLEAGLRHAERRHDRRGRSQVVGLLGAWHRVDGNLVDARSLCRQAIPLSQGLDPITRGLAVGNLGSTLIYCGEYREAESLLLEALRIAVPLETRVWEQATCYNLSILYRRMGEHAKALHNVTKAEELYRLQPMTNGRAVFQLSRARLLIDIGRYDEAREQLRLAFPEVHEGKDSRAVCEYLTARGELARIDLDLDAARRHLEELLSAAQQHGLSFTETEAAAKLAVVLAESREHAAAARQLEPLLDLDFHRAGRHIEATIALASCVVHGRSGSSATALAAGRRATALFAAMPEPLQWARSLNATADVHDRLGQTEPARRRRAEAARILERTVAAAA